MGVIHIKILPCKAKVEGILILMLKIKPKKLLRNEFMLDNPDPSLFHCVNNLL